MMNRGLPVLLTVLALLWPTARGLVLESELPRKQCVYTKDHGLSQALCNDRKLNDIPAKLPSGIEVLEARENRIREIRDDSLSSYKSLRFVYLQDNFIQKVSEGAFDSAYYLEAIDLSTNGLSQLPRNLFQLQYLRNVYLSNNYLEDASFNVSNVHSPIERLHVSGNKLTRLPRLYPLPSLNLLNVSNNAIKWVTPEELAPLCSLKKLDLRGNPLHFDAGSCECHDLKAWLEARGIAVVPQVDCPAGLRERCNGVDFSNRTKQLSESCSQTLKVQAETQKARAAWIWIAGCVGLFVSFVFVFLCCLQGRNKDQRQRLKEQEILQANSANAELLNQGQAKEPPPDDH